MILAEPHYGGPYTWETLAIVYSKYGVIHGSVISLGA